MKEIENLSDIKQLVDSFYEKVKKDDLLGPIFDDKIGGNWPVHLQKMYRFWQTVLLQEHTYKGSPFLPHAKLPVDSNLFDRWIALFNLTIDENFTGEKALEAKNRAQLMASMFQHKIEHFQNSNNIPLK